MAGAYLAKPEVDTTPSVPPGWDINWPFPGVYPPGYEPELSLELSGDPTMPPSGTSGSSSVLLDQELYPTKKPQRDVEFSAVWKGGPNAGSEVKLKVSGEENYASIVEIDWAELADDFWGTETTFEFHVDVTNVGEEVTLTAIAHPVAGEDGSLGDELSATRDIIIVAEVVRIEIDCVVSGDETWVHNPAQSYYFLGKFFLSRFKPPVLPWLPPTEVYSYAIGEYHSDGDFFFPAPGSWTNYAVQDPNTTEMEPTAVDDVLSMRVDDAEDTTYHLSVEQSYTRIGSCDIDVIVKTYKGDELVGEETYSRTCVDTWDSTAFATVDGGTGAITMLSPPTTVLGPYYT